MVHATTVAHCTIAEKMEEENGENGGKSMPAHKKIITDLQKKYTRNISNL